MTELERQIQEKVNSFAAELGEMVRKAAIDSVLEKLSGTKAAPAPAPAKKAAAEAPAPKKGKPGPKKGGRKPKHSADELDKVGGKVTDFLKANPDSTIEAIGKGIGLKTDIIRPAIKKLMDIDKKLKKKGQKRATTYHLA